MLPESCEDLTAFWHCSEQEQRRCAYLTQNKLGARTVIRKNSELPKKDLTSTGFYDILFLETIGEIPRKEVMQVRVKFLVHKGDGELLAVFPDVVADMDGNLLCFLHIGQHGAVSKDYIRECRAATFEEKTALYQELRERGYYLEED